MTHSLKKLARQRYLIWDLLRETDAFYLNHHLFDVDFSAIEADRQARLNPGEPAPSYVAYALAAYGRTLATFRSLNSYFRRWPRARLAVYDQVDVAVTIERDFLGQRVVLLSVLTDAASRPVADIHAFLQHRRQAPLDTLAEYTVYRRLLGLPAWWRRFAFRTFCKPSPASIQRVCGTTAFTSIGRLGSTFTTPLSPCTCTMSLGRVEPRPRAVGGTVAVRPSAWVTLTYDHRVADGADIARAGNHLRDALEQWNDTAATSHRPPATSRPPEDGKRGTGN